MADSLDTYLKKARTKVDRALHRALPPATRQPQVLHEAMRHSVFAGGKRLRPILALAAAEACGGDPDEALPLACAVECIHTFSLIHDDLPCMDDDDMRRGRPTCHKVYGDAVALLAGDALQAAAFAAASTHPGNPAYSAAQMIGELAVASGSLQLVGGQVLDMQAEQRTETTPAQLRAIHLGKTAALLTCALRLGAMSAAAGSAELDAVTRFGRNLGLAFQVVDDILDVTQNSETLGKTAGKDTASGKATYPAVHGIDGAKAEAARFTRAARKALVPLGERATTLHAIADRLLVRDH